MHRSLAAIGADAVSSSSSASRPGLPDRWPSDRSCGDGSRRSTFAAERGSGDQEVMMPTPPRRPAADEDSVEGLVGHVSGNAVGRHLFADPDPGPDEVSFHEPNLDERYYTTGYYAAHQNETH